ncbi:MAG TPA: peptidase [Acidobacteriota bacterium]|nr:peptidase [Acidobacteriota bacterium]
MHAKRFLLFFIDGLGVGEDDPSFNPLATGRFPSLALTEARTPTSDVGPPAMAGGVDASLGVPGLPQSATGQTAILTGVNAPAVMGHHLSGFPGPTLRRVLMERSILKRIVAAGSDADFLNAFGPRFFQRPEGVRRMSATTLATLASGRPFRTWEDLVAGKAVVHDLTHWRMRDYGFDLPARTPEEAGRIVARESQATNFSLFEYFETDRAGHAQDRERALRCLEDLDRALRTVLVEVDLSTTTVTVVSDHGNVEDERVGTHTRHPAFFAAWGAGATGPMPRSLTDIVPFAFRALGIEEAPDAAPETTTGAPGP